jgi:hypothetical protein
MNCSSGASETFINVSHFKDKTCASQMKPSNFPPILTADLMNSIREHPTLAPHTWYIIAATTLTTLNRPDEVPRIYEHAITLVSRSIFSGTEHEEQLTILRRMREALIKTSAVVGVPKVCVALLLDRCYYAN